MFRAVLQQSPIIVQKLCTLTHTTTNPLYINMVITVKPHYSKVFWTTKTTRLHSASCYTRIKRKTKRVETTGTTLAITGS